MVPRRRCIDGPAHTGPPGLVRPLGQEGDVEPARQPGKEWAGGHAGRVEVAGETLDLALHFGKDGVEVAEKTVQKAGADGVFVEYGRQKMERRAPGSVDFQRAHHGRRAAVAAEGDLHPEVAARLALQQQLRLVAGPEDDWPGPAAVGQGSHAVVARGGGGEGGRPVRRLGISASSTRRCQRQL